MISENESLPELLSDGMGCFQSSQFRRGRRREDDRNLIESSETSISGSDNTPQILNFDSEFKNIQTAGNVQDDWTQKGLPLQRVDFKWRTSSKLSNAELKRKQEIFWETCSTYGGQAQVWDALKSICNDKQMSLELSRTILESCGVILPCGQLTEIYDETGFRYNLPPYCVCAPIDLIVNVSEQLDAKKANERHSNTVKLRLSNGKDLKIDGNQISTVSGIKKYITESEDFEDRRIVIIWRGQVLTDEINLKNLDLPKDAILQAMIP